jgi:anthranilate phosphoribosyltransferase
MAVALAGLGVRRAFVIHGRDGEGRGLDEASIEGPTQVVAVVEGDVHPMAVIHPADLGIPVPRPGVLGIAGLADSLRLTSALLEGRAEPALADAVALQAALGVLLHRGLGLEALGATFKELRSALDAGFALPFEAGVR